MDHEDYLNMRAFNPDMAWLRKQPVSRHWDTTHKVEPTEETPEEDPSE